MRSLLKPQAIVPLTPLILTVPPYYSHRVVQSRQALDTPFETRKLAIGGETLELHFQNILVCIRSIYGDPEFAQDLAVVPEHHYTDQEQTDHVFSEMYTGDWWWAVQVCNSILY